MSQVDELFDQLRRDPGGEFPSLEQIRGRARRRRRRRTATAVASVLAVLTLGAAALGSPDLPRVELAPAGGGTLEVHEAPEDTPAEAPEDTPADHALPERRVGSWRSLPASDVVARDQTVSTWTGSEVLVWGGARVTLPEDLTAETFRVEDWELFRDGAAFNPASDTWRPMRAAPLSARVRPSAAWTGQELLVWGGADEQGATNDGAAYDPELDRWRMLAPSPLEPRTGALSVWTGQELLVWGGSGSGPPLSDEPPLSVPDPGIDTLPLSDGAAYDPVEDRWRLLPEAPRVATNQPIGVWDGREMLVFAQYHVSGMAYDPGTDGWRELALSPPFSALLVPPIWTGEEMVLPGVFPTRTNSFALAYDPETDLWRGSSPLPEWREGREASELEMRGSGVWVDGALALPPVPPATDAGWAGAVRDFQGLPGAVWHPDQDAWEAMTEPPVEPPWPKIVLWTGDEVLIWGGEGPGGGPISGLAWRP